MATPPDSPIEEVVYELETTSRVPKPIPVALEDLCRLTKFTRQEIRIMYRGFKAECPEGVVHEASFKDIYAKFFPHGSKCQFDLLLLSLSHHICLFFCSFFNSN